jgi:hypothetical protein
MKATYVRKTIIARKANKQQKGVQNNFLLHSTFRGFKQFGYLLLGVKELKITPIFSFTDLHEIAVDDFLE